jgi:hypothetical protein
MGLFGEVEEPFLTWSKLADGCCAKTDVTTNEESKVKITINLICNKAFLILINVHVILFIKKV